ncbi:MAG: DUF3748 domain-containing protein [Kiritimatiellae bacterium]|nr:DUF3748 domain-containing protein [Kiritimatiellia bacterium]
MTVKERAVTSRAQGHTLTNIGVWSPDSEWLIYDLRVKEGVFSGTRIERVNVESGAVQLLYESGNGACCGVVTCSPVADRVVFIHGPERPTPDWEYGAYHRYGMVVDMGQPGRGVIADARDLTEPLTPGALRGGTHVHVFSGDGEWISFTYEDALLAGNSRELDREHINLRNVGVCVPAGPVTVGKDHPRNHDGAYFTVLVTRTTANPKPGSDEISRAFSDGWVGVDGYIKADGTCQRKAIAFQGHVRDAGGATMAEVFIVDLPDNLTKAAPGYPLEGTTTTRPNPPAGVVQRRLTFTAERKYPGLQGPRHWLRSSPDGSRIAFLMKDDGGVVQLWTISPKGGAPCQITRNQWDIQSAFSWNQDGSSVAYVMDNSVFVTDVGTGASRRLTGRSAGKTAPTHHCCVFSPDNTKIAFMRPDPERDDGGCALFVVDVLD